MNFTLPTADAVYDALFGNLLGFVLLIIVIIAFVGVIVYRKVNPKQN
jgi:hypothetical protein